MNKILRHWLCAACLAPAAALAAPDATEIMKKAEQLLRVETMTGPAKLTTGTAGKVKKTKYFDSWRKLQRDGVHFHTLTRFTKPADIDGEAVLLQEFKDNQNNVFIYLPRFKKTRRVEGYDQGKSFMGTVFSYSDVTTFHFSNYKFRYLAQEKCGSSPGLCHKIESVPRSEDIKKRTRYSRTVNWVSLSSGLIQRTDAYDLDGELLKKVVVSKYVATGDGKFVAAIIRATRVADQDFSQLEYSNPKVGVEISDSLLSEEGLSSIP